MTKNIKLTILVLCLLSMTSIMLAQQQEIQIWPGIAPGSEDWKQKEAQTLMDDGQIIVRNVVVPTLTVLPPDQEKANGTAMIVAPGGGFEFLMWQKEGVEAAKWLASKGVTVFLLKYRLKNTGTEEEYLKSIAQHLSQKDGNEEPLRSNQSGSHTSGNPQGSEDTSEERAEIMRIALEDGRQAIRVVRQRASEWKINQNRIGIMGFSAGGIITIGALVEHDPLCRPDFAASIYGPYYGQAVPADVPPVFILVAGDDPLAALGSIDLYKACREAGQEAELHVYSKGGHGFGMQVQNLPSDEWIELLWDWMGTF